MMKERIKEIIEYESISYSKFADIIGIQRSGVSHLINGRNNPSLDVIQKILESFDYINSEWLLLGKGNMKKYDKHGDLFNQTSVNAIVNLSWNNATAASNYDIYIGETLPYTPTTNTTNTNYIITLQTNTTYFWKIIPKK